MVPLVVSDPLPVVRIGLAASLRAFGYVYAETDDPVGYLERTRDAAALVTIGGDAGTPWRSLLAVAAPTVCLIDDWDPRLVRAAVRAGATGVELRSASPQRIAAGLDAARAGDVVLPMAVVRAVVIAAPPEPSGQEMAWIRRLAQGETVAALARDESYSERQMFRLLADLWRRLGVSSRHEAIATLASSTSSTRAEAN